MKISKEVKRGMYQKLKVYIEGKLRFNEFNRVFMFLDGLYYMDRVVPYKIFENNSAIVNNLDGFIFKKWVECKTLNIEKDFNKGRKLVRLVKEMCENFSADIAFTMGAEKIFMHMLRLFLLDLQDYSKLEEELLGERNINKEGLRLLRQYIAMIFAMELLVNSGKANELLYLFLTVDDVGILMSKIGDMVAGYSDN